MSGRQPGGIMRVDTMADLAGAIVEAERLGCLGTAYLFRALRDRRICLMPVYAESSACAVKSFMRATAGRPTVALLCGDDYTDTPPAAWRQADRIARWAKGAFIHAAGAELEHYEAAIQAAERLGRFALVECSSVTAPAWVQLFRSQPHQPGLLLIQPTQGQHPLPLTRGQIQ
jgi:hypothetical protein